MRILNTGKPIKEVLIAFVINVLAAIAGAALLSWMIMTQRVEEKTTEHFVIGIIAIAAMLGGIYAVRKQTNKRWASGAVLVGTELLVLFGANIILCDSSLENVGYVIAAVLLGNLSAYLIKNKKKKRSRKYRNG